MISTKWIFMILMIAYVASDVADCEKSISDLKSGKYPEADQMLKFSGRSFNDLGHYIKCSELLDAKYTLLIYKNKFGVSTTGLCGPITCTTKDYEEIGNTIVEALNLNSSSLNKPLSFYNSEEFNIRPISSGTMIFIIFSFIFCGIVATGTYLHTLAKNFPNQSFDKKYPILINFSIIKNFNTLTTTPENIENTYILNGIKVLLMILVTFAHSYYYAKFTPIQNPNQLIDYFTSFAHRLAYSAVFAGDIFFLTTGFLLSYITRNLILKNPSNFSWGKFAIGKLIRVIPIYFYIYIFYLTAFNYIGYGPAWPIHNFLVSPSCDNYWYSNFIFLNNLIPYNKYSCMEWSWFIADYIQFLLFVPIIIVLSFYRKAYCYLFCGFILLANLVIDIVLTSVYEYNPGVYYGFTREKQFTEYYEKPYVRIGAFIVGIFIGIFYSINMQKNKEKVEIKEIELGVINSETPLIPQAKRHSLPIEMRILLLTKAPKLRFLAWVIIVFLIFAPYRFENHGPEFWSSFSKVLFLSFESLLLSLSFSIIVVFWMIENSGLIKSFLASKFMIVASRVCLAYYLIHPMVIIFTGANSPQDIYIENSYFVFRYFGVVVLSALFAILLTIMITYPIIGFEKMILSRNR
ncbi:hypothetical protein SteCoe_16300 [Stentor coeruleus]|uniref:Acyltransferase 3 domain-containing protein n=1 Tax=Stentor coeruleus TaxID=5963 RepID=A0A1R2C1J3_9CILI|nr:hypothetical protein SteCoe_16300 [Stentor coeruleus]